MAEKGGTTSGKASGATREDRLKAALKANLQKRKAQARSRNAESKTDKAD